MTTLTDTQVITASGGLVELGYSEMTSGFISVPVTAATSPTTILSDMSVVCDGGPIAIEFFAPIVRPGTAANNIIYINLYQDGAESDRGFGYIETPVAGFSWNPVHLTRRITPTAGLHTFSIRAYSVGSAGSINGGSGGTGFSPAFLRVSKIVQATQWPAVTTGTIICTSSTRPAAPFEGQKIYETDTDRELTYDATAWVQTSSLGGWSTWTPQLYQNGNLTSTIPHARYTRIGDTAIVQGKVSATQAGTAGQQIEIRNLPYSAEAAGDYTVIGNAIYWDGVLRWQLNVETLPTATSIAFGYDSAPFGVYGGGRFGASPSKAVASTNFISFTTTYEIA